MASLRGAATVANIEAGSYDYSAIDSLFSDAYIEDKITEAELLVEAIIQETLSSTSADRYKRAVILITRMILLNELIEMQYSDKKKIENFYTDEIMSLLNDMYDEDGADIIPLYRPRESW